MDIKSLEYQIPQSEIDARSIEVVQNPDLQKIGDEIAASYETSRFGATTVDASRLEFVDRTEVPQLARIGLELVELRQKALTRNDFDLVA